MFRFARILPLVLTIVLMGCYAATIDTGLPESNEEIVQTFASSWIYGLVPPDIVETVSECPHGVAKVETRLSFVNQLVGFITLGIYTPMEIRVTCAAPGGMGAVPDYTLPDGASVESVRDVFAAAATRAVETREPAFVAFGAVPE